MKRQGYRGEGEIVKAHLAKGGKRETERERNGARTESEGAMRVGSVARKVGSLAGGREGQQAQISLTRGFHEVSCQNSLDGS